MHPVVVDLGDRLQGLEVLALHKEQRECRIKHFGLDVGFLLEFDARFGLVAGADQLVLAAVLLVGAAQQRVVAARVKVVALLAVELRNAMGNVVAIFVAERVGPQIDVLKDVGVGGDQSFVFVGHCVLLATHPATRRRPRQSKRNPAYP